MAIMRDYNAIVEAVTSAYPDTQAIYRFGSWGTPHQRADSDLDIAVLLPHHIAVNTDIMDWAILNGRISCVSRTDYVDLINLQTAATSIQAEIIRTGDVIFCQEDGARVEFEALVLSMYQDLTIQREQLYQDMMAGRWLTQP